jgi:hypothetical protein
LGLPLGFAPVVLSEGRKAFKAALEAKGLMLANGDTRDCFVVIDEAGGHHALNKKLTGMTLAAVRERVPGAGGVPANLTLATDS